MITPSPPSLSFSFVIPNYLPPTLNVLLRTNRYKRGRLGRECTDLVIAYSCLALIPQAKGKRKVSFRFTSRGGERVADHDARLKLLLDALVHAGLLVDDSPQWCELGTICSAQQGPARETVVTLEDIS